MCTTTTTTAAAATAAAAAAAAAVAAAAAAAAYEQRGYPPTPPWEALMRKAPVNSLFSRAWLDFTRAFHLSTTALHDAPGVRVVELPQCNEFRALCRCAWCFRKQRSRRERWLFGREHVSESRGARGEFYTARFIAPELRVQLISRRTTSPWRGLVGTPSFSVHTRRKSALSGAIRPP